MWRTTTSSVSSHKIYFTTTMDTKFHVVFFNICPISFNHLPCPTARDLPEQTIRDIAKLVDHTGTFVINLMTIFQ
ncbi:hypothetical protein Y032_0900g2944 [Ancylostoma ceylanicum]|uniref:Uncharacterized protein n=1 Tax=Ancylostoma ceylanicum TaxID=53326 RepID=A0A016WBK8_9BILA|nr:hypothetical protein Y032_0900g2944 [Ancylostoma ceylanicum]